MKHYHVEIEVSADLTPFQFSPSAIKGALQSVAAGRGVNIGDVKVVEVTTAPETAVEEPSNG